VKSPTLLGVPLSLANGKQVTETLSTMLKGSNFNHIATVNPEFLVEAACNQPFKTVLNNTQLNVVDGIGIKLWGRLLYKHKFTRITGVELAEKICKLAASQNKSVYFLGGFGVAAKAAQVMQQKHPTLKVAGTEDGDPTRISEALKTANADVVLVAFGAPAQELWINKFKSQLPTVRIIGGFGGTFDFWTGKATRAPKALRVIGLEWFWRLITQPKRIIRIYKAVIVFSYLALKERFIK